MKTIIIAALLMFISPPCVTRGQVRVLSPQAETQRLKRLGRLLESGSLEEKSRAIGELSWPKSEEASRVLLKKLRRNLAKKTGHTTYPGSYTDDALNMVVWTESSSDNEMLVYALAKQGHVAALPTLRKMQKMKPQQSGIHPRNLAYCIYRITRQPVTYEEDGELKTYFEHETRP